MANHVTNKDLTQGGRLKTAAICLSAGIMLSACGMDYDKATKRSGDKKTQNLGVVHFRYGDNAESYDVDFKRVRGGYSLEAPMWDSENGSGVHFVTSHTSERKGFVGIQSALSF